MIFPFRCFRTIPEGRYDGRGTVRKQNMFIINLSNVQFRIKSADATHAIALTLWKNTI